MHVGKTSYRLHNNEWLQYTMLVKYLAQYRYTFFYILIAISLRVITRHT